MRFGALVEYAVFGVLWLLWKGGTWLGLTDDGRALGPGTPVVMPDEFAPVVPAPPPAPTQDWLGHIRSKTLHRSSCRYAPSAELAQAFPDRASAEALGFRPCRVCCRS